MSYYYFSVHRPVSLGTCPKGFAWFGNFAKRRYIPCIGWDAWGVLEYHNMLTPRELDCFELERADLEWVTCYRDLLEPDHTANDNLIDILVPVDWLKKYVESTGDYESYEEFENEYTADDTEGLFYQANADDVVYGVVF